MKNTYYILRHAETKKELNVHATLWGLSDLGIMQSKKVATSGLLDGIDIIVASDELKAQQTAEPLAKKLCLSIVVSSDFREVERGDKFLTQEEFEKLKKAKLEDLDCDFDGGGDG